ncbi:MAG: amino acid adenylation domain-containing protein [Rhizobiaceae bacterium]|nr:amino acid adenylation domain-containing protein [Rhizobiaceae bacterium]
MPALNIADGFWQSAERQPGNVALTAGAGAWTYGELRTIVGRLAGLLAAQGRPKRVGILASRSMEAYAGILAAGAAGATYVPLNLKWPAARLATLMGLLELDALVVDVNGAALLNREVMAAAPPLVVVADAAKDVAARSGRRILRFQEVDATPLAEPVPVGPDHVAYIIFTSGTTGLPKGVMISAASLDHYLSQTRGWTALTPDDRLSETCDVTFDLTVHNMFLAFQAGASLHLMSQLEMLAPARFIRSRQITVWMSVPTLIGMMRASGALKPGIFPSLRQSIFCGEPLPLAAAQAWAAATPNGTVENIYGPTEGTVICMRQRLTDPPVVTEGRGIVAIGTPYPTMDVAILDSDQNPLPDGQPGEIALCGPQLALGYFAAPDQTADRFRAIRGRRWYLTGDLGRRDADGTFHHLGRTDSQVKVKGNRIELEEIEAHLRDAAGTDTVAAVAWPVIDGSPQGLVGFAAGGRAEIDMIEAAMLKALPRYMVPADIRLRDRLPVNVNGKIDRRALFAELEQAG